MSTKILVPKETVRDISGIKRDEHGRFISGTRGGPGRAVSTHAREYLDVILSTCTPERWALVVERALEDAQAGDWRARKWLSDYIIGPAIMAIQARIESTIDPTSGARVTELQAVLAQVLARAGIGESE